MSEKNVTYFTITGLLTGVSIIGILAGYFLFHLDDRWLWVAGGLFVGFVIYCFGKEKDQILILSMLFLLPYGIGFMYTEITKTDMFYAFDLFLFLLFGIWMVETNFFQKKTYFRHQIIMPGLLMVIWTGLSIVMAVSKLSVVYGVTFVFRAFLILVLLINKINTKKRLLACIHVLLFGLAVQGVIGLLQRMLGRTLGLTFIGELQYSIWWELARSHGTFGYPNQYAAYLVLLLPMAISFLIFETTLWKRTLYLIVTALGAGGLFFSLSRSSWVGMVLAILVLLTLLLRYGKISMNTVAGAVISAGILALLGLAFADLIRLRFETGGTGDVRMALIKIALRLIAKNPLTGVGLFNFPYYSFSTVTTWHAVHNTLLRLASETGVPNMCFFIWFTVIVLRNASSVLKNSDVVLNKIAVGIIGGYTAFLFALMYGPEYSHYRQKLLFWILAAFSTSLTLIMKKERILKRYLLYQSRKSLTSEVESYENIDD